MSKEKLTEGKKVATSVAISEVEVFLKKHLSKEYRRGLMTEEKVKEDYLDVIEAVEDGLLVFEKGRPVYTLRVPLFEGAEDSSLVVKTVNGIRSRIKEADRALVMDGIDIEKKQGTFVLKMLSFITQLSLTELKQLEKEDYRVLQQIASVF